jgi:2'-5' RNA ligase
VSQKTHQTAVVIIPPESCWEPIQAIRREHDRQVRRWMPHVTLLYPFRPREEFAALESRLRVVCAEIEPFEVHLGEFRHFEHGRGGHTLWLAPEPAEGLVRLQAGLACVVPDCDDTTRHQRGFTPHLSVGQVRGRQAMTGLKRELQSHWRPLSFQIAEASLIWRNPPPDDVFRVDRVVPLGR